MNSTNAPRNGSTNQAPRRSVARLTGLRRIWTGRALGGAWIVAVTFGVPSECGSERRGDLEALLFGVVDELVLEVAERGRQGLRTVDHPGERGGRLGQRL